jgi:hypothetical protein
MEKIGDEGGVARPGNTRLSPKHGVNSSLMQCFRYEESYGVALAGLLKGDAKGAASSGMGTDALPQIPSGGGWGRRPWVSYWGCCLVVEFSTC